MSLYSYTRERLRAAGLRPRKRLGQSFLVDARVLDAIIEAAELTPEDVVLEIGAGIGTLTQRLASSSGEVMAVELDERLFGLLQSTCQNIPNVTLIHADILELDFSDAMNVGRWQAEQKRVKIIGNLPYYITTPILMKVLEESSLLPIQTVLAMVQKEVGERIAASPGTKDYGSLSIAVAYRANARILEHVPANSFYPKPLVDSVLLKLSIRSAPPAYVKDERLFFQIVRASFQYRRKTLRNALLLAGRSHKTHLSTGSVDSAMQALCFDPRRRGETLSVAEFAALTNMIVGNRG